MGIPYISEGMVDELINKLRTNRILRRELEPKLLQACYKLYESEIDYETADEYTVERFRKIYLEHKSVHTVLIEQIYELDKDTFKIHEILRLAM